MTADRRVLHPQKGRAALLVLCGVVGIAIGVGALTTGSTPLGAVVALIGLAGLGSGLLRLLHPRTYALEIDERGFRVHDVFGRVAHDVPWRDLRQLVPTPGNAPLRPGGEVRMAWLCFDDAPGAKRRRKRNGILIDGVLPDPYGLEPEELAGIMVDYSRRAAGASAA